MLPLLALLAVGGGLLALGSGGTKKAAAPVPAGLALRPLAVKPVAKSLPTLAQLLLQQEQEMLASLEENERIRIAQALSHRPPKGEGHPDVLTGWAQAADLNATEFRRLTPWLGWWKNTDEHHETLWRAQYKLDDGGVQWWINDDGSFHYEHVWGGFDPWKSLDDLAKDALDAGQWLGGQLSKVDWDAVANDIEFVASFVPVIGTAVSDIVATVQTALDDLTSNLSALGKALMAGYEYALASVPGGAALKNLLDGPVKILLEVVTGPYGKDVYRIATGKEKASEALVHEMAAAMPDLIPKGAIADLVSGHVNVGKLVLEAIANQVSDSPKIGGLSPRSIVSSLLASAAHALGV